MCGVSASQAVVADELSVKVEVEDFVTCDPVVTATFPAGMQRVAVEWAKAEDGEFVELGAVENPEGTAFVHTNALALIADRRWYRVTATDADGSVSSAAVPFVRFRNLDRCLRERRLLAGFCEPIGGFTTAHMNAFDGNIGTTSDNGSGDLKTGFKFLAPVYIAGLRLYARNDRMNGQTILGAVTSEDYAAGTRIVRSASLSLTTGTWGFVPTTDPDVAYRYCWLEPLRGDCAEMEVYGWTAEDLANPAGDVSFDFTDVSTLEGPSPIIMATFQAGVESATLQRGRRADGTFVDLMTVQNPQGTSFVYTNFAAKVGQTVFYRVKTTDGGSTYVSHARPFARFRHLERDPADNSKVRDGYTRLTPGKTQDFDGKLDTHSDRNPHGINFNEQVYVAGLRLAPRVGWGKRLAYRCAYAYRTAEDYDAGNSVRITPWIVGDEVVYRWFDSTDTENAYQFCRIDCDAGDLAEMEIYGWTMADIGAAGDPFFPTSLDGENGAGDGEVVLAWAGGKNLDSYRVQYREKGETEWIDYGAALPTNVESTVVSGFASGVTYEFRVAATGDGETGYSPTAEVLVYHLVPGPGTGLSRTLMAMIASRSFDKPLYFERGEVASIDMDETADTLFAHTNFVDALVMYRGKIIIPVAGTYVFGSTVKGSDGQSLFIDGVECFNAFSSAGYKGRQLELTAGEHTFELDYRSVNKTRFLAFTWALQGVWSAQPVPTSQLIPAVEGEFQDYAESSLEGWRFILPTGSSYISKVWRLGNQSFRMIGEISDFNLANVTYLSKEVKGAFYLDFEPENKSGRPSLFVRDSKSGQSLAFIVGGDFLGMKDLAGGGDWGGISWTGIAGYPKVRIQRDADGTLRFLCHASNWPNEKWHVLLTMPQGTFTWGERTVSITSPRLQVGFVLGGNNSARADVRISNFKLTKRGGMLLFVR